MPLRVQFFSSTVSGAASALEGKEGKDFRITVYDANEKYSNRSCAGSIAAWEKIYCSDTTNMVGQVWFRNLQPGWYRLIAWFVGYEIFTDSVPVDQDHTSLAINLRPQGSKFRLLKLSASVNLAFRISTW